MCETINYEIFFFIVKIHDQINSRLYLIKRYTLSDKCQRKDMLVSVCANNERMCSLDALSEQLCFLRNIQTIMFFRKGL